ncbi:formyltransferase family protein [Terrisporobacter mayombei]|uniref:formyltransferase family protein n=1 Tax=Terrisporobacter mayombei TaxID=1541 RepID=UPI002657AC29|nr:formyltransferase family protein [Terrisporobacter mayombei]MCC3669561.1 methionyl-tRNA formyltransferase [Terrisporobacter mayombei]
MDILIVTTKEWNKSNANIYKSQNPQYNIEIITENNDFTLENIKKFNPDMIFFPHWSWLIPKEIYEAYECIVFHMTDLPYGRGGSPLQNLISRNIKHTKISALRVDGGIDTGDIYLKEPLDLYGSAEEIFVRASHTIFNTMIPRILNNRSTPIPQEGTIETFQRFSQKDNELKPEFDLNKIYNYIRMVDGEGYPNAFIKFGDYKIKFSNANLKYNKIVATVEVVKEEE